MPEKMSFIKAVMDYFEKDPHGRKIEIPEFKALTIEDKMELHGMLIAEGYDVEAPMTAVRA